MSMQEIKKEYEQIISDLKKIVEEELKEIGERINALEIEVEKVGKETEEKLNNNKNNKRGGMNQK
ncbi:hypothetical protein J7L97_03535 [Candidatus Bathyarchaeota archaeon]|nr:hypothetical protein [Candidatus Bathyarchaeota archaeon]